MLQAVMWSNSSRPHPKTESLVSGSSRTGKCGASLGEARGLRAAERGEGEEPGTGWSPCASNPARPGGEGAEEFIICGHSKYNLSLKRTLYSTGKEANQTATFFKAKNQKDPQALSLLSLYAFNSIN